MHAYRRPQVDEVTRLLTREAKPLIIAVVGPRQTGKTTVIRQVLEQVNMPGRYLAVDEVAVEPNSRWGDGGPRGGGAWLHDVWREARRDAEQGERGFVLALDEIQHVDGWSLIAKAQWDRDRRNGCPLRVIVAGSAPWSMMTGLHESLAGRFMPVNVGHWSYAEMSEAFGFTLDQYLFFGGYPGMADEIGDPRTWRSTVQRTIISPAIEKDIVALSRIEKPALMRRLMALAAHYSGQVLSYNKMLGQLQEAGNVTTLSDYLNLLSEASLVTGLPKYSGAPHVALGSSPKLNVLNTALMTAQLRRSFEETRADRTLWGRIVESAVGAHLHNTAGFEVDLYHWREARHEVDFVLSRGLEPIGIEVKSGGTGRPSTRARGLRTAIPWSTNAPGRRPGRSYKGIPVPSRPGTGQTTTGLPAGQCASPRKSMQGGSGPKPGHSRSWRAGRNRETRWPRPDRGSSWPKPENRELSSSRGEGSPWLWHRIGRAYMLRDPGSLRRRAASSAWARSSSRTRGCWTRCCAVCRASCTGATFLRSARWCERTERSVATTTPTPCWPALAEALRRGGDPLRDLDEAGITRAVGARHLARFVKEPTWYRRAIQRCPRLSADALVTVYRSLIRARSERSRHLACLFDDERYGRCGPPGCAGAAGHLFQRAARRSRFRLCARCCGPAFSTCTRRSLPTGSGGGSRHAAWTRRSGRSGWLRGCSLRRTSTAPRRSPSY